MRDKLATRTPCANVAIKGMTTDRLLELDGVVSVRMSITDSSARVEYEPSKIGPTHIGSCVGQMGYSYTVKSMLRTM
jgi:copper chaperone CopZ